MSLKIDLFNSKISSSDLIQLQTNNVVLPIGTLTLDNSVGSIEKSPSKNINNITFNNRIHQKDSQINALMFIEDFQTVHDTIISTIQDELQDIIKDINNIESTIDLPNLIIASWDFKNGNPPEDWVLCTGATYNGYKTPDMRDRFVVNPKYYNRNGEFVGSDPWRKTDFYYNDTGGESSHVLTEKEMPEHRHIMPWGEHGANGSPWGYYGVNKSYGHKGKTDNDNIWRYSSPSGSNNAHNNMPPYIKMGYIMYIGGRDVI